jgi:hypothetical protein
MWRDNCIETLSFHLRSERCSVNDSKPSSSAESGAAKANARRRLIKGSLSAPVAMTLFSNPVSAGSCLNASAFASVSTFNSRHPSGTLNNCTALSPAQWQALAPWPSGVVKGTTSGDGGLGDGTKFNAVFSSNPLSTNYSLLNVLGLSFSAANISGLAPGVVALYLDAAGGRTGPMALATADVVAIWANINANGGYKVPSGTVLTLQQTRDWLTRIWT